jgi:hypothetical protein
MADGKKSFLIYCDIIHTIEHLTDEEKGKLFQHLLEYVNDMNPILTDRFLLIAWKPIELQLKRDLKRYESICERNSKNGAKGGRPKKPKKPTGLIRNPKEPKKADTDNDTEIEIKKEILNSQTWLEGVGMKLKKPNIKELLIDFLNGQELEVGEGNGLNRDINEIKNHFVRWAKKQKEEVKETPKSINLSQLLK